MGSQLTMVTRAIGVTSVWDLIPDDSELYSNVFQEHFANTDLQVIAIFKVCHTAPSILGNRGHSHLRVHLHLQASPQSLPCAMLLVQQLVKLLCGVAATVCAASDVLYTCTSAYAALAFRLALQTVFVH